MEEATGLNTKMTKALRQQLRDEKSRTGLTAAMLLDDDPDKPRDLTSSQIDRWIGGLIREAPADHVSYVLERYAATESNADSGAPKVGRRHPKPGEVWIEVTAEMSAELRAGLVRSGLDFNSVITDDAPDGLTARVVRGWLYGEAGTTRGEHWRWIVKKLAIASAGNCVGNTCT